MLDILYLILMILVFLIVRIYFLREKLTMQELEDKNVLLDSEIKKTQTDFQSFVLQYEQDQARMKDASDKASSAQLALSAAAH